jgi:iron complex outermembrane receptor protein
MGSLGSKRAVLLALGLGVSGAAMGDPQAADGPAPAEPEASRELAEVQITGSRVKRSGFDAPNPLTVVSAEQIEQLGQVSVAETLNTLPQNTAFQSDTNIGIVGTANVGSTFANLRGLNPFYGTRTLTLVDSRRFVPTSDGGAVDLNMIPSMLVGRIETVTGGASAAYGSDAVAGVVNVILDKSLEGIKSQIDYGQTFFGDGRSKHASLAGGFKLAGGRAHVLLGAEYHDSGGVGDCAATRVWCAQGYDIFTNSGITALNEQGQRVPSGYNVRLLPNGQTTTNPNLGVPSPTYGQPNFVIGPGSKQSVNVAQGVFRDLNPTPAALRFKRFNDAGTALIDMDPGEYNSTIAIGPRQGGDGDSTYEDSALRAPIERYSLFSHLSYNFTDSLQGTLEASFGARDVSVAQQIAGPRSTFFIRPDNAFLPPAVAALFPPNGQASLGKDIDSEEFRSVNTAKARTFRVVAGLSGDAFADWTWDAYYQYGRNTRDQTVTNTRVNHFFQYALDAVRAPNGEIVCRAVLEGNPDAAGCVPMNLFGTRNLTPEAVAYAYRTTQENFEYDQNVVAASLAGDLFKGWGAGPIGAAIGAEYRTETGDVTHGNIPYYNQFAFTFGLDFGGDIEVAEAFTEINVPLLRDKPFARFLELNAAVRKTRNSNEDAITGSSRDTNITSWKASAIWDPLTWLRLRGTRSRDIRAAGFRELYQKSVPTEPGTTQGRVNNPFNGNVVDDTPILGGGDFGLTPELADTTTAGFVLSPGGIAEGLRFSADWYQIKINDAITTTFGQQLVDFCFNLNAFCDRITFAGNDRSDIAFIRATQVNLSTFTSRGADFEVDYTLPMERLFGGTDGYLNFRLLAAWNYDLIVNSAPGAVVRNFAGQTGPNPAFGDFNSAPKWLFNGLLTYARGGFSTTVNVRHVDSGKLNILRIGPDDPNYSPLLTNSISDNTVSSATYVTLAMTYNIPWNGTASGVEVFGVINNLFDKDPPIAPGGGGGGGSNYPTNPVFFDTLGAQFRLGLRARF